MGSKLPLRVKLCEGDHSGALGTTFSKGSDCANQRMGSSQRRGEVNIRQARKRFFKEHRMNFLRSWLTSKTMTNDLPPPIPCSFPRSFPMTCHRFQQGFCAILSKNFEEISSSSCPTIFLGCVWTQRMRSPCRGGVVIPI